MESSDLEITGYKELGDSRENMTYLIIIIAVN